MNPEKQGIGCVICSTLSIHLPPLVARLPSRLLLFTKGIDGRHTHHTSMAMYNRRVTRHFSMSAFPQSDDVLTRPHCSSPRSRKSSERHMRLLCGSDNAGQKSWTTGTLHQPVKYAVFDRALHMPSCLSAYSRSGTRPHCIPLTATHHHRNHNHRLITNTTTTCSEHPFSCATSPSYLPCLSP